MRPFLLIIILLIIIDRQSLTLGILQRLLEMRPYLLYL